MINPESPHFVEPPEVTAVQDEAERVARQICEVLRGAGWDYALVSVARVVRFGGVNAAPGSCAMEFSEPMVAALGNEAVSLRRAAAHCEALAKASGVRTMGGYVQGGLVHKEAP